MRVLVLFLILIVTNLITFGYTYNRCKHEKAALQNQLRATIQDGDEVYVQYKSMQDELKRLRGWNNFVELQKQLNQVVAEIGKLNFGTAIQQIDAIAENIRSGKFGPELQARAELIAALQECKVKLEQKEDSGALAVLADMNRRVLQVFSGVSPAPFEATTAQTSSSQTQTGPIPNPEPK